MSPVNPAGHIVCVVGARPNFMKIAPIMRCFRGEDSRLSASLVHTGQHYDAAMKQSFFDQLGIPEPDCDLGVGSGSHAVQTADIMKRFEPVLDQERPSAVLVVGDVNSTIACSLVAVKKGLPVIHVEAGLRSGDRTMPEEINRILTDQLSELLFTTERDAAANLAREGVAPERVHFVGNVMIDTLLYNLDKAVPAAETLGGVMSGGEAPDRYGLLTLHRPANVDDPDTLRRLLETLSVISRDLPLIFPIHPRTRDRIEAAGLQGLIEQSAIYTQPPMGYLEMLGLMRDATAVFTDSGGIQEETTALGVPCVTLRESTERPITATEGTNTIVGSDSQRILDTYSELSRTGGKRGRVPEYWDGKAAPRIYNHIVAWLGG
ncbi:non-hydrolyzing UDP-N-acetylglucosamine 2-epimerase [Parahaliea mediterranea]|uniref:UDP-N-acetylglucosamine 2-epimerase (Non-hydrolyzing) n=1 Tax=Parahaliea mediterranea TaxID=651086 RepID=A0A939DH78_9GAMM|nr:UDP-N-acetylglucosamine 2-epimerase (non-hydrolyzing) [Parahaliea mediterranea]MBN7797452.1 UDP-N-acetylglucosamine 2-epimerase (non-hydrolyzing) [Parahaliea mediterranea]